MAGIYKHSNFTADIFGHGGNKRTAQINDLLKKAGIVFKEADFSKYEQPDKDIRSFIKGFSKPGYFSKNVKNNYAIGRHLLKFELFLKACKPDFFIWESTGGYCILLSDILSNYKIPFVAIPHNLESLVGGSQSVLSGKSAPLWLNEEIKSLKHSNFVFTISREENWLLNVHGIDSSHLPYFPCKELTKYLLEIRQKRIEYSFKNSSVKNVLLLGTFYNVPTLEGYKNIINELKGLKNIHLNIAGYGSELLIKSFDQENISILGSVTSEILAEVIVKCDCALIHQEPTSGALTRISELLLAGIPILANVVASRSYYNQAGITTYNNISALINLLQEHQTWIAPLPLKPLEEDYFVQKMIQYCNI